MHNAFFLVTVLQVVLMPDGVQDFVQKGISHNHWVKMGANVDDATLFVTLTV